MNRMGNRIAAVALVTSSLGLTLVAANSARPASAEVSGVLLAQLYPSWTRVNANCTGKGRKIRCRIKGKLSIVNDGDNSSAATKVEIWVSSNDTFDPKEDQKVQTLDVPEIPPSDETELSFNFSAPKGTKVLKRHLIAVVDPKNVVPEFDETDNEEAIGPLR